MSATAESLIDELADAGKLLHAGEPDTNGELDGSPDIAATGFGPRQRYPTHGEIDSRAQAINDAGTQSLRGPELPRVLSCGRSADKQACSQFVHDLPDDVASGFEVRAHRRQWHILRYSRPQTAWDVSLKGGRLSAPSWSGLSGPSVAAPC